MVLTLPTQFDDTLGALYVAEQIHVPIQSIDRGYLMGWISYTDFLVQQASKRISTSLITRRMPLNSRHWVLNAFHLALTSHAFYYYSITNFVKPEALVRIEWSLVGQVITSTVSDSLVRASPFVQDIWEESLASQWRKHTNNCYNYSLFNLRGRFRPSS
ncbi:hypothetical protein NLI96_g2066 [Meripilus lineatus]|uniref:Uncharacterized protein n=1 Tax=Meripilus lineatus TaxID=2056292 RepID=A0AAD5V9E4_9APHY|nr:hypothetical protein NLI96_g2066 [Physisporinus lineatus]